MPITHGSMKNTPKEQQDDKDDIYIVDDASEFQEQEQIHTTEYKQSDLKEKIVEPIRPENKNKKIIEDLICLGRHSKVVDIGGHSFEISTLTHREETELMRHLSTFGSVADLFTIRTITVCHCLRKIDDVPFEDFDVEGDFKNKNEMKLAIIDSMQRVIVERLYSEYVKINDLAEKDFVMKEASEEIKN